MLNWIVWNGIVFMLNWFVWNGTVSLYKRDVVLTYNGWYDFKKTYNYLLRMIINSLKPNKSCKKMIISKYVYLKPENKVEIFYYERGSYATIWKLLVWVQNTEIIHA